MKRSELQSPLFTVLLKSSLKPSGEPSPDKVALPFQILDMLPAAMSAMCHQVLETGPCVDEEEAERAQQQVHLPSSEAKRGDKLQYV